MQDILEVKHKVMQDKIQKQIDTIGFCYSKEEKEQQNSIFLMMQTISRKYEQCYQRIKNSNNVNKSLKYRQLEKIVFEEIVKIEIEMQKDIIKKKDKIVSKIAKNCISINYLDKNCLEKLRNILNIIDRIKQNLTNEQLEELEQLFYKTKFDIVYKRLKDAYIEKEANFYEEQCRELENIEPKEMKMFSNFILERYTQIIEKHEKDKQRYTHEKVLKEEEWKRKNEKIKEFYNKIIKKLGLLEKTKLELHLKVKETLKINEIPISFFKDENLLEDLINLDIDILPSENIFLLQKKSFFIFEFHATKAEMKSKTQYIDRERKVSKAEYKLIEYYTKEMESNDRYSIIEICNILFQFNVKDFEISRCNLFALNKKRSKLWNLYKCLKNNIKSEKIFRNSRKCNILKVVLNGNKGTEDAGSFCSYQNCELKYTEPIATEDTYNRYLKRDLEDLKIWNKFYKINENGDYEVYINLEDLCVPYNVKRLEKLQEEQKQDISYIEAEKECRICQLEEIENETAMLIDDNQQILEQIINLKKKINQQDKSSTEEEKNKITNLLNTIENDIRFIVKQNFESVKEKVSTIFPSEILKEKYCEKISKRNLKQLENCNTIDEKIILLEKIKKAHILLGEVLNKKSFIEELFWEEKFKLLKDEAIKNYLLGKAENVFVKFCNEHEIAKIDWKVEKKFNIKLMGRNSIIDLLEYIIGNSLQVEENWKYEYLKFPIYQLSDFIFDKNINRKAQIELEEFLKEGEKYSILEVHRELKRLEILQNVKFDVLVNNKAKVYIYDMYKTKVFDDQICQYLQEEQVKQIDKIKHGIKFVNYVKDFKKEDYFI